MGQNEVKIWAVTKNGNLRSCYGTKDASIAAMRTLAKAPKAEISDQSDGSVRLKGVAFFRTQEVTVL